MGRKKVVVPSDSESLADVDVAVGSSNVEAPQYVVERAKSARSQCKRCNCRIEANTVRVGMMIDGDWGLFTRWQHLQCTVFHKSVTATELDGYRELAPDDKKLVNCRVLASASEVDEDYLPVDPDELVRMSWDHPAEPPPELLMPLLPYQKEGLGWMVHQETTSVHGGILADEMGMGESCDCLFA